MIGSARAHRTARLVAGATLLLSYSGGCAVSAEVEHTTGGFPSATTGGTTSTGGFTSTLSGGTSTSTGGVPTATGGTTSTGGTKSEGLGGTFTTGGSKASTGGIATGGVSTTGGAGGAGGKSATTGGAGGASGGVGGGGAGGGSAGKSGTGGGGGADACNWAGCSQLQCATACPAGMGDYCAMTCSAIIACIRANPTCGTTADPMCVKRSAGSGTPNACTPQWESGSGSASPPGPPAKAATDYFNCACGITPTGTGGATGTGGTGGKAGTGGATGTGGKAGTGGASTGGAGGKGA